MEAGTKIKSILQIKDDGGVELPIGSVLEIRDPNYFGRGLHLAVDSENNPWCIDDESIDSKNAETNDFTVVK